MNMTDPKFLRMARQKARGKNIFAELLLTIALFMAGTFMTSILMGIIFRSIIKGVEYTELLSTLINLFSFLGISLTYMAYVKLVEKRSLETMGFTSKNRLSEYLKGLVLGFLLFFLAWLISLILGGNIFKGIKQNISIRALSLLFLGFMIQGMTEEVVCRGFLMVNISRRYGLRIGIIVNSLFFSALHLANPGINFISLLNIFLVGLVFSLYMVWRENIWGVGAMHTMWNFAQGNIFGVAVSGMDMKETIFLTEKIGDNNIINGGIFGIEGSLAGTIVLVIGIIVIYRKIYKERT